MIKNSGKTSEVHRTSASSIHPHFDDIPRDHTDGDRSAGVIVILVTTLLFPAAYLIVRLGEYYSGIPALLLMGFIGFGVGIALLWSKD